MEPEPAAATDDRHARIEVPPDPRDLPGAFTHRYVVDVRFGDTDAMGHANNSRFLTYWSRRGSRTGRRRLASSSPSPRTARDESLILAEVRVAFRSPAVFGETLTVETRAGRVGRSSFALQHRITASASDRGPARLVATADDVMVMYDYAKARPQAIPEALVVRLEAYEGRRLRD